MRLLNGGAKGQPRWLNGAWPGRPKSDVTGRQKSDVTERLKSDVTERLKSDVTERQKSDVTERQKSDVPGRQRQPGEALLKRIWLTDRGAATPMGAICKIFFSMCVAALLGALPAAAQQTTLRQSDIPHIPTDTLPTDRPEVRIVTFADGTFRFIPTNPFHMRTEPAFATNWDTINLFAYRNLALRDLPAQTTIRMSESYGYRAPASGKVLSKYGRRGRRDHNGIDIKVAQGEPIFAAFDGIVRLSRWNSGGFGNIVVVRHASGLETYYAHLSLRAVVADQWVAAGQVIGYGGRTGRASTTHLHFETRYADQSFDPQHIIDFDGNGDLRRRDFALKREFFNISSRAVEGIEPEEELLAEAGAGSGGGAGSDGDAGSGGGAGIDGGAGSDGGAGATDDLLANAGTQNGTQTGTQTGTQNGTQTAARPDPQTATQAATAQPDPLYHRIVSGDTLLALALRYGTTVGAICTLNNIARTATLRIGRELRIR